MRKLGGINPPEGGVGNSLIDRAINEWQNYYGAVSMPKDSIGTRVVTFDTAEHLIISYHPI